MKYLLNWLFSCTAWSKGWGINSYRAGGEWFHDPKGCACWIRGPRKRHYRIRNWSWVRIQYNIEARSNTYRYIFYYIQMVVLYFVITMMLANFSYLNRIFFRILEKPWKPTNSHSDKSQNITKEPRTKNTTNISNGTMDHKGDTNATIYAGIVIGIIMVIVIALMMYLSRKKVSD